MSVTLRKRGERTSSLAPDTVLVDEDTSSDGSRASPFASREPSPGRGEADVVDTKKIASLKDRGRSPPSLYLTAGAIVGLQFLGGIYSPNALESLWSSIEKSTMTCVNLLMYVQELILSIFDPSKEVDSTEYMKAAIAVPVLASIFWVFIGAPFKAGLWTGRRATRHVLHRYMGLAFMVQYALAWVEYSTNYGESAGTTLLPHSITLNGMIQAYSAYFSFKVLPELDDAGYISDKAVMSRSFLHENIFYQLMCVFGSVYYHAGAREGLRSHWIGRGLEIVFVFLPYVVLRPFFPTTRFKDAGTRKGGRSEAAESFYRVATRMVKLFYLWAKYFLGFHINFMVFLDIIPKEREWVYHGLFLLNAGTVSLAIFLHTLRFRKILPARFAFSIYLVQIYLTFTALPYMIEGFVAHPKLCLVSLAGLLCNMTRSKNMHAAWSIGTLALLNFWNTQW